MGHQYYNTDTFGFFLSWKNAVIENNDPLFCLEKCSDWRSIFALQWRQDWSHSFPFVSINAILLLWFTHKGSMDTFHSFIFSHDSNSVENAFCRYSIPSDCYNLCTCQDSAAAVLVTRFCRNHLIWILDEAEWNVQQIQIMMQRN